MKYNKICTIVIPVYKEQPDQSEVQSFIQVLKTLNKYEFCLVCPENLNITFYLNLAKSHNNSLNIKRFSNHYFKDIKGYNKLMLSLTFYKSFIDFKYILIYQLDAWVFEDKLKYWCDQNYDYIGAPWFYKNELGALIADGVGNGGFSLRKVKSHVKVLKSFSFIYKLGYTKHLIKEQKRSKGIFRAINDNLIFNNTYYILNRFKENEDKFWGLIASRNFKWFIVPKEDVAQRFSVERFPSSLIKAENILPFGCHAWEKYGPELWKKYINQNI